MAPKSATLVQRMMAYLNKYVVFQNSDYPLPLALWVIGTYLHMEFDSYPYVQITSSTKRSGKTRLSELMGFAAANAVPAAALTAAGIFRSIKDEHPTLILDESESLKSEAAGAMRSVLNVGYRKGQEVRRMGKGGLESFPTYCPKIFIAIGDAFDTLRDRSIIVRMRRASVEESEKITRFVYNEAQAEGAELGEEMQEAVKDEQSRVMGAYLDTRIPFLNDRDEEIWTPLFALCKVFAPSLLKELERVAADMATEKTHDAVRAIDLLGQEKVAETEEYTYRLLTDMLHVMKGRRNMFTRDILAALRDLPTAPWRRFRTDEGLTEMNMADMLARFPGCAPKPIRVGSSKSKDSKVARGYRTEDVQRAMKHMVEHGLSGD